MAKEIIAVDGHTVFARQLGKKTIEIKRGNQLITITGDDFSVVATPSQGKLATTVMVKDGQLDEKATTGEIAKKEHYDSKGNLKKRVIDLIKKYGDQFDAKKYKIDIDPEDYKEELNPKKDPPEDPKPKDD